MYIYETQDSMVCIQKVARQLFSPKTYEDYLYVIWSLKEKGAESTAPPEQKPNNKGKNT